jgi:hypothetical protein
MSKKRFGFGGSGSADSFVGNLSNARRPKRNRRANDFDDDGGDDFDDEAAQGRSLYLLCLLPASPLILN